MTFNACNSNDNIRAPVTPAEQLNAISGLHFEITEGIREKNCTNDSTALLEDFLDDDFADTYVRPIRGPSISALHWSGSDGDMTWVCLFVVILALCFAIPLIVVIFWTHPHSSGNNNTTTTN